MARTTPAQNPRGFKRSTRLVAIAESLWPRLGESSVVVVTGSSIPCPAPPQHLSGAPDLLQRSAHDAKPIAHGRYTNPPSASVNGAELQPPNFKPPNAAPSPVSARFGSMPPPLPSHRSQRGRNGSLVSSSSSCPRSATNNTSCPGGPCRYKPYGRT